MRYLWWLFFFGACNCENQDTSDSGVKTTDTDEFVAVAGWSTFTASADSQIIYVSSSIGDDTNDCLSETAPCKTMSAGVALLRDGMPDWLLLARG